MTSGFSLAAAATALAVVALLVADKTGSRLRAAIAKPLASAGFLAAAWHAGAAQSSYGRSVLVALVLSALGDVLLLGAGRRLFVAGLASFLLAHLAFCASFVVRGIAPAVALIAALPLVAVAAFVWRWLGPHVEPALRAPVVAYIAVLSAMVALAVGTSWARPALPLTLGALAFYASDFSVAREEFVAKSFKNRLWGLPAYYAGQLLIAASVAHG